MFANINGRNFKISFAHSHEGGHTTTAQVFEVLSGGKGEEIVLHLGEGSAYCHPSDNFNKEAGRKIALERALQSIPFFANWGWDQATGRTINPKPKRRAIWAGYFARSPRTANRIPLTTGGA